MDGYLLAAWRPLAGGVLLGLASWLLLAALGRVTGISGIAAAHLVRKIAAGGWPSWSACLAAVLS
jgi:hypothetical protein